jgi:O-methyltransferase
MGFNRQLLRKSFIHKRIADDWFLRPYFTKSQRTSTLQIGDPVRYGTILLALEQIDKDNVSGAIAECGVWKGYLSKFIRQNNADKIYYLFDTFEGFSELDKDNFSYQDSRFKDTSEESVLKYIGDIKNIVVRKGFFPATSKGLENEQFAFVVLDFDKYEPTFAALAFFYPRLAKGGYIFVHDYNSPESNWACSRALNEFLKDKPEQVISIPDAWGSAVFRKV